MKRRAIFIFLLLYINCFGQQYSKSWKDLNYAGDSLEYHRLDIYLPEVEKETYPAVISIYGSAWFGNNLKESDLSFMQDHILILSGLYGVLKPNDGISLYRLEMQDQTLFNLYDYWKPKIGTYLKTYCKDEVIINLASEEYSKVIPSSIKMITLDFIEMIKGRQKRIAMHVKTMRGLCARYLIQNRITSIDDIKMITLNGYSYDSKRSTADLFVFTKEV